MSTTLWSCPLARCRLIRCGVPEFSSLFSPCSVPPAPGSETSTQVTEKTERLDGRSGADPEAVSSVLASNAERLSKSGLACMSLTRPWLPA